jgi:release factor glutamine methyltransferase
MTMPVAELIRLCKIRLEPVAGEEALQQAKWIVSTVIGVEPAAIGIHAWMQATQDQIEIIGELLEKRVSGEPLQYILGEWQFYGLPFYTDERALIPRQDTELLVETALDKIKERGYQTCLDLCTGSGCIGIAIAKNAGIRVTCSDVSEEALSLARENMELNEVEVKFINSDLFDQIPGKYDLIVCNPPYLTKEDMDALQKEVSFEPSLALDGGADGLDFYRRIAREYRDHLNDKGMLLLEIGSTQARTAAALFDANTSVLNDLGGNPRVLVVEPQ